MERRLAAILAADIVNFSRLISNDEEGAIENLKSIEAQIIEPLADENKGHIVKKMGDGYSIEFSSVTSADNCALIWQNQITAHNAEHHSNKNIEFRIGVNLGDIIFEEDDVFGDGVNVAARLESIAAPGAITVSDIVYQSIKAKINAPFEDLGPIELKNTAGSVHVYGFRPNKNKTDTNTKESKPGLKLASIDRPSIAVLPFTNMSGDPEQEYFSDGITEDLITGLSRVRWFFVGARNSSFVFKDKSVDITKISQELGIRYVLEGSIRKAGNRVRVTAQLIEGETGTHLWAKKYDRARSDIFDMQDEITETIIGALEPELNKTERQRSRVKKPQDLGAWEFYQRAMSHLYQYTKKDLYKARELFDQALDLDENLGPAYSGIAEAFYYEAVYGFSGSMEKNREKALNPALRAVALDRENASAHCTLGRIQYLRREFESAILELKTALNLNPSLALAHYGLGAAYVFSGDSPDGVSYLKTAIRLSPRDPNMGSFLVRLADASLFMGDYDEAIEWAQKALQQPNFQWSRYAVLISALGHLNRVEEAQHYLQELLSKKPEFSLSFVRNNRLFADSGDFDKYLVGLN